MLANISISMPALLRRGSSKVFLTLLCLTAVAAAPSFATQPIDHVVQLTVSVAKNPAQITVNWVRHGSPAGYAVYRRSSFTEDWNQVARCDGGASGYTDTDVRVGACVEYKVAARYPHLTAFGYVYAGIDAPLIENRGKLVLLVEESLAVPLKAELERLSEDLVGDGWVVLRHDVSRYAIPAEVKAVIQADYSADPLNVKSVFLLGHIPMYMSGNMAPDEHLRRPWPADIYYADMRDAWPATPPTTMPGKVNLQIGRVNMFNLPAFAPLTEIDLLRRYLDKDHNYRCKTYDIQQKAIVDDHFGEYGGSAFAQNGWRNFPPFVGAENVASGVWTDPAITTPYLWGYACGPGTYRRCGGVTNTAQMNSVDPAVFTLVFGSYFGQWDATNALYRALIATPKYGLVCGWAGFPNWFVHPMALGETIGLCTMLTQNNTTANYEPANRNVGRMHVALMGDPTLRAFMPAPASALKTTPTVHDITLSWNASPDAGLGYYIYRSAQAGGPYTRISAEPVNGLMYCDTAPLTGENYYMVRAITLQTTPSGSFYNASQGVFVSDRLVP